MIKTLVVDDSATIRALISAVLGRDPGIEVVGRPPIRTKRAQRSSR